MADQNIVTNITATANFSSLTAQLQAVAAQMQKLQVSTIGLNKNLANQVGVINRQFDETMRSTGQFSRHFVTLNSDVSKFGKNLDAGRLKLKDYYQTWQGHTQKTSSLVQNLAKQQVLLQNAIIQPLGKNAQGLMQYNVMVQSGLDATKNKTALMRQELAIMNKVMKDGAGQLINWGKNTQWAGRQLTVGLTVPLVAFGAAAAKAFKDADQQLVRLTKVYGGLTASSSEDLLKVRKDVAALAKELASTMGSNFTETIALAADIAATGKQGKDLLDSTRESTRLATLGEIDRQDAMKATLSIQTAFGQSAKELTGTIDFLNAVENQTSTSLADLTEAIPKAGPVVKALGGDVKDLALYLTAMREGGINASEGANALKSALASIINPTKVARGMFMEMGIDLGGIVEKNAGNLTGTIMALKDSLDTLDPLSRARAIEQLFGKFQFARINALFENLGKQGSQTLQVLDLMKASTTDLANISERELKMMTESASGRYKRALESIKADLSAVGEQFLKVAATVLNAVDGIIKFIGNLPGPIKAVLGLVGSLTAIAGPIIMLTGVLANFFGYIIKGIFSLKNIGKGGTGFKLLTPELMAASAAAKTVEESFYSDTKAAATFSDAVLTLSSSFAKLKENAMSSTIATSNSMSTVAGNPVLMNGARVVDKNSPYVGKPYSRDMSHMIPTGSKTPDQRSQETIFSTVPGPKPVNQRVLNAPQSYMNADMPRIPGVTSINNVSTGVVASEAAKWHSMTAAIAMQSEAEILQLKQEIAATGTITKSLSDSYKMLLPEMTKVTSLAADETGLIVKSLQAGKITAEQARMKIAELNLVIEKLMVETAQGIATAQARNINFGMVPLTGQSVVSKTGQSNMKELFHKTETAATIDAIAKNLGVRTSGAGYSIQTTMPRKLNSGGYVYHPKRDGAVVPGDTSINYDNTMAKLPIGGFVLNQEASKNNSPLVDKAKRGYQSGGMIDAVVTPGETVVPPKVYAENKDAYDVANKTKKRISFMQVGGKIDGRRAYGNKPPTLSLNHAKGLQGYLNRANNPDFEKDLMLQFILHDAAVLQDVGFSPDESISLAKRDIESAFTRARMPDGDIDREKFKSIRIAQSNQMQQYIDMQGAKVTRTLPDGTQEVVRYKDILVKDTKEILRGSRPQIGGKRPEIDLVHALEQRSDLDKSSTKRVMGIYRSGRKFASEHTDRWNEWFTASKDKKTANLTRGNIYRAIAGDQTVNQFTNHLNTMTGGMFEDRVPLSAKQAKAAAEMLARELGYKDAATLEKQLPSVIKNIQANKPVLILNQLRSLLTIGRKPVFKNKIKAANSGGEIPGYNAGGAIGNVLKGLAMRRIGAGFGPTGAPKPSMYESAPWGVNSLSIKMAETLFANSGLRKNTQKLFYDKFAAAMAKEKPYGYVKDAKTGSLKHGLEPDVLDSIIRSAASDMVENKNILKQLSPIDKDILRNKYLNWDSKQNTPMTAELKKKIFDISGNREMGGPVSPGQNYLVGEKGPELFSPSQSGKIIPGMNSGGKVPAYGMGGMIGSLALLGGLGYGANLLGGKIGGTSGSIIGQLGNLLPFLLMGSMGANKLSKRPPSFGRPDGMEGPLRKSGGFNAPTLKDPIFAKTVTNLTNMSKEGKMSSQVLARLGSVLGNTLKIFSRGNLILAGVTTALVAGYKAWTNYKEGQRLNQVSFGLTEEAAKKAGLQFRDFGKVVKQTVQTAKDASEANKLIYDSMLSAGTPFSLTVAEYTKLKEEIKTTMPDLIASLNKQPSEKIPDAVRRIKEQFIAAGMSAEEATKKLYAALQLSDQANQARSATIQNPLFNSIKDPQTNAVQAAVDFGLSRKNEGKKEQSLSFNTATQAIETAINDLIEKREKLVNKDTSGKLKSLSISEATKTVLDQINTKESAKAEIGKNVVKDLSKTNKEVSDLLNGTENLVGVWAKLELKAKGFRGNINALTNEQAGSLAQVFNEVGTQVEASNRKGLLSKQYDAIDALDKKVKGYVVSLKTQTAKQQISDRDMLASLNKQIEANNKLAESRKKALSEKQKDADLGREIEKTRLAIQNANATGDTGLAQSLRIDLESLTSQQQTDAQTKAIDTANEKANAPLKKAIENLSNKNQALADKAAIAAESLDTFKKRLQDQKDAVNNVNAAMTTLYTNAKTAGKSLENYVKTPDGQIESSKLISASASASGEKTPTNLTQSQIADKALKIMAGTPSAIEAALLAKGIVVNGNITISGKTVDMGGTGPSSLSKADQSKVSGKRTRDKYYNAAGKEIDQKTYNSMPVAGPAGAAETYVIPDSKLTGKIWSDRSAAARAFAQLHKTQWVQGDYTYMMNGLVYEGKKAIGAWYASTPDGTSIKSYKDGGLLSGPGTGTSDSIYMPSLPKGKYASGAYVSNGEFIVNANAVRQPGVLPLLEKINNMQYSVPSQSKISGTQAMSRQDSPSYVTLNQYITATDGMDTVSLANMIVRKAEAVIGNKAKVNIKMVGESKSI